MLTKLSERQLKALASLSRLPQWQAVNEVFSEELQATLKRMVDTPDIRELHVLQGRAKVLTELQLAVSDAPNQLKRRGFDTSIM